MNKLVIIGNGFDLAHDLPTSYKDFILWHINTVYNSENKGVRKSDLISIDSDIPLSSFPDISKFEEYEKIKQYAKESTYQRFKFNIEGTHKLVNTILDNIEKYNWVDIEKEYYEELKRIQSNKVEDLNKVMYDLKQNLSYYLLNEKKAPNKNRNITNHFKQLLHIDDSEFSSLMVLNFNYTNTVEKYVSKRQVNYIHGKLNDKKNPMIFGYGDETDKKYKEFEDLEKNEYLKHMKSFAYLQTPNYRKLFNFLDTGAFEIHIMGHSLGLSDRLLFKHIFEHENFNSVKIYFYEYLNKETNVVENDFFEKTQNLSRYFDLDSKHKMRTKVVPFNESQPLTPYKPKES